MRIDQKYFVPFILGVALICVLVIVFFNMRTLGGQQERFVQAIQDGSDLHSHAFFEYVTQDSIRIADLSPQFTAALFFSSWSNRGVNAFQKLNDIVQDRDDILLFGMAVKDDESFLTSFIDQTTNNVRILDGTEFYSDFKIPGLPSLVVFDKEGNIRGLRMGYTGPDDYAFLITLIDE